MKSSTLACRRSLVCSAALLTLFQASPARAQIQVDVNNRQVQFGDAAPVRIGGRVFIPLRAVVEALGAEVRWSGSTQTVFGKKGTREFALPIGSNTAQVNGRSLALDAPARLIGGNTMVPLRFVAEALGANVDWNASEQKVAINLGGTGGVEEPASSESVSGELISVQPNGNPPTITMRVGGQRQTYRIGAETQVTRGEQGARGRRVDADQLRAGDQVSVRLAGRMAEQIDATGSTSSTGTQNDRTARGEVIRVVRNASPPLLVVMVNGARQTYDAGSAVVSHRTGRRAAKVTGTLTDVVVGDDVVVTLDRTGQIAERIDATHVRTR